MPRETTFFSPSIDACAGSSTVSEIEAKALEPEERVEASACNIADERAKEMTRPSPRAHSRNVFASAG